MRRHRDWSHFGWSCERRLHARPLPSLNQLRTSPQTSTTAVAQLGGRHFSGAIAWLMWLFVHLLFLVGYRSRIVVLINWAWHYLGYRPVARVFSELAGAERRGRDKG